MNLLQTLNQFCAEHITEKNDWYTWSFDEKKVPIPLTFSGKNQYEKNILIKEELHKAWKNETNAAKKG